MGRKAMNLAGQQFGNLTVIKRVYREDKKNSYWLCACSCGKETTVAGINLKNGKTLSCGCLNNFKRRERYKDITGKQFGRLTAEKRLNNGLWLFKCACGNSCEVSANNIGKSVLSCGCIKTEELLKDCVESTRLRNLTSKKRKRINKDSGVKGVVWDSNRNKWLSQIKLKGKTYYLGRYADLKEAIEARQIAEEKLFKPILKKYDWRKK